MISFVLVTKVAILRSLLCFSEWGKVSCEIEELVVEFG